MQTITGTRDISSQSLRDLAACVTADDPVAGLTHNFYLYPARFSPVFVKAAISAFTEHGDLVLDPFMGGGTTLVQAAAEGRVSVGCDINELAVFVARVKTDLYSERDLRAVFRWAESLMYSTNLRAQLAGSKASVREEHFKNASTRQTWHVRKLLEMAVLATNSLRSRRQANLARCILLRLGRWALDCRLRIPKASELRSRVQELTIDMLQGAREFSSAVHSSANASSQETDVLRPIPLHASIIGIDENEFVVGLGKPKLVVCSPPYPGTHILYHRWQVRGRRETPAPYWIAGCTDGRGASFYTMGGRSEHGQQQYFKQIQEAFSSLAGIVSRETVVVQLISFSKPAAQLPLYLNSMEHAGFTEHFLPHELALSEDSRLWRTVPNRRWYTYRPSMDDARREVVLFHSLS